LPDNGGQYLLAIHHNLFNHLPMAMSNKEHKKCYNCIHASEGFKIAGKTHFQCMHPIHQDGMQSGELTPWDTLQEWYNTCDLHELKPKP